MKEPRWNTCNVLSESTESWRVWNFDRTKSGPSLKSERQGQSTDAFPVKLVSRNLNHLWQPLVNVAWLPPHQVFLRVIEVPAVELAEVPAMVEFDLERLSPLPVTDILWSCEVLPGQDSPPRTVLVTIAAREAVEELLGQLEEKSFLPDRLELPQVRELMCLKPEPDSTWILTREVGEVVSVLHAWWSGGRLRHVELRAMPITEDLGETLAENLTHTAWAGEVAGWHDPAAKWHLVADSELTLRLEPALKQSFPEIETHPPVAEGELAVQTAAAKAPSNLLPEEASTRYRQEFVDRLWMRSLGGVAMVYIVGVLGFFALLNIQDFRKMRVDDQVALLHSSYTNALALKARQEVLRDQVDLKFAALDCLKAASDALPADMTLNSFSFQRGRRLNLFGTVPSDLQARVTEFSAALADTLVEGEPLFTRVETKAIQAMGNRPANWTIECEFRRPDIQ